MIVINWLRNNRQNIARWGGTILAIVLTVLLVKEEGGGDITSALKRVSIWYFLAGILIMLVSRLFVVVRWYILLRSGGVDVSFNRVAMLTFTGLFGNNFLPTTIGGDVVRLAGAMQLGYDRAICLASLVADRLIGMAGMSVVLPFGLFPVFSLGKAGLQSFAFAGLFQRGWDFIKRTFDAFSIWLKKPTALLLAFLSTLGNMVFIFFAIFALVIGMDRYVSFWLIAGLWSLTYFVTLIPISVNGYGVQELSLTFLLSKVGGLTHSESLTIAILIRTLFIITSLPGTIYLPSIMAAMSEKKNT